MELILPLLLTIPIVFLGSCLLFKKHWIEARFCTISSFFVASSLTWGLMTTIGDIYSAHDRRDHLFKMGSWTERFFDDRSILITDFPDPFFGNIRNGVKFANPSLDSFEDVKKIVKKSESSNYKLYFFLSQRSWTAINNLGALDGYDLCRYSIGQGLPLVVLSRNNCGKAN